MSTSAAAAAATSEPDAGDTEEQHWRNVAKAPAQPPTPGGDQKRQQSGQCEDGSPAHDMRVRIPRRRFHVSEAPGTSVNTVLALVVLPENGCRGGLEAAICILRQPCARELHRSGKTRWHRKAEIVGCRAGGRDGQVLIRVRDCCRGGCWRNCECSVGRRHNVMRQIRAAY